MDSKQAKPRASQMAKRISTQGKNITKRVYAKMSRQTKIYVISALIVVLIFGSVALFINQKYIAPVDRGSKEVITVNIPRGSGPSKIANILEENGLIRSTAVFKLYLDLNDKGSKLMAGTYDFSPSMTIEEIVDKMIVNSTGGTAKYTLTEGGTVENLATILVNKGAIVDKDAFLKAAQSADKYKSYDFITKMMETSSAKNGARRYALEGYLFPDTYIVYKNATPDEVIEKMLTQFDNIFTSEYLARADELNMSVDEVITMASIIEKEGRASDFKKVSAVFHNRIKQGMPLQCCSTVQYVLGIKKLNLSAEDTSVDSPYNTYKNKGLPAGPICNPGKKAIEAALYPDEDYVKGNYLYFCSSDPKTGSLVFSKTLDEHNANVAKYRPVWQEYDKQNGY